MAQYYMKVQLCKLISLRHNRVLSKTGPICYYKAYIRNSNGYDFESSKAKFVCSTASLKLSLLI